MLGQAIHRAALDAWAKGMTVPQIAAQLDVGESFVKSLLKRTRDAGGDVPARGPKAHAPELVATVLDSWAEGATDTEICDATGLRGTQVHDILHRGRLAGDPRAARRMSPRKHPNKKGKRTAAEAEALREGVLKLWQLGDRADDIANECRIKISYVYVIVRNARDAGDTRAYRRRAA